MLQIQETTQRCQENEYEGKSTGLQRDSKKLFQLVFTLTGATKQKSLPEYSNPTKVANDLANFFINEIKQIRDMLDHHLIYRPTEAKVQKFAHFREMSD